MSIRTKIMLAIISAVVISTAGVTFMVSYQMNKAFINHFHTISTAQLAHMESFVNNFFNNATRITKLFAQSAVIRANMDKLSTHMHTKERFKITTASFGPEEKAIFAEFNNGVNEFPAFAAVFMGNENGGFLIAPEQTLMAGYDPRTREWYFKPLNTGGDLLSNAYVSATGDVVCTVAAATSSFNGGKGAVGIDMTLDTLTKEIGGVKVGTTGYVMMLDASGQVVIDPQNSGNNIPAEKRWLGKTPDKLPPDAANALQTLHNLKNGVTEVNFNGKTWLAGVHPTEANWTLILVQEKDEVFASAMSVTLSILAVGLAMLLIMTVVAWALSRSIAGPLGILVKASQEVANGKLEAIPAEEAPFKAELGLLHKSLKSMVAKLSALISEANSKMRDAEAALAQAQKATEEMEAARQQAERARREGAIQAAGRMSAVIEQLSSAASRLTSEVQHTDLRATEQSAKVAGAAAAIDQMTSSVAEVAAGTNRTAELADKTRGEAGAGKTLVMDLLNHMKKIEKQSLAMRESLADLGVKAGDIGQIMGVINDIADQTNLLALNAAIEAARAGEAGRGFAVVADEVRKLAEKTMMATKQVGDAITSIQQGANTNVQAMHDADAAIGKAAELANRAGSALTVIEDMIKNTANEVNSIALASKEQSIATEEINRSTVDISRITEEVAGSSHRSSDVVKELSILSRNLTDIVRDMQR